jgi:opacity protein-like surface antigen
MNRRGDTDQYVSSDESMGKYTNEYNDTVHLELDWMVSVIGRAGWLATPTTLLYGLGGWSYAHFDVEDVPYDFGLGKLQDFHANGPTVGGGIEQKLSPKWSLRAEYRYTDFGKHSFSTNSRTTDKDSSSDGRSSKGSFGDGRTYSSSDSGTSSSKTTNVDDDSSRGSFDNDMHVGRVGVTRYCTWGD